MADSVGVCHRAWDATSSCSLRGCGAARAQKETVFDDAIEITSHESFSPLCDGERFRERRSLGQIDRSRGGIVSGDDRTNLLTQSERPSDFN